MQIQNPQLKELFKTPQRKTYSLITITFILVGFFVIFVIRPTFLKIAQIKNEIKEKTEFKKKVEDKLSTLNYLIVKANENYDLINTFNLAYPKDFEPGFVIANISKISENFDMSLISYDFSEKKDQTGTETGVVEIKVSLEGTLANFEQLIDYIEKFPRIMSIKNISYTNKKSGNEQKDSNKPYTFFITVDVYHSDLKF